MCKRSKYVAIIGDAIFPFECIRCGIRIKR